MVKELLDFWKRGSVTVTHLFPHMRTHHREARALLEAYDITRL